MSIGRICPRCKSTFALSTEVCLTCQRPTVYKVRLRTVNGWKTRQATSLSEAQAFLDGFQAHPTTPPPGRSKGTEAVGAAGCRLVRPAGPSLGAIWLLFLNHISDRNRSWKDDEYRWNKHIGPHLNTKAMSDVSHQDILGCIPRDLKPATKHRILELCSRVFSWAIRQRLFVGENPCVLIDKPRYDNTRHRYLSDPEQTRLLAAIDAEPNRRVALVVKFLWASGRRRGETLSLQWSDIDLQAGSALFRRTKNGRAQRVPLNHHALEVLRQAFGIRISDLVFPCESGKYFFSFNRGWLRIRAGAGLEGFHLHDLRSNFASRLASSGKADILSVSKLLGHSGIDITVRRYAALFDQRLRDASELMG